MTVTSRTCKRKKTWIYANLARSADEGKVLDNLYKIMTKEGHGSMTHSCERLPFNSTVRSQHVSSSQLKTAPAVNEIDIVFKWEFNPSDLKLMVQAIQKSNIRFCKVNLNDCKDRDYNERLLGRGRYESLLELLSVAKIRSVYLSGMSFIDKRSSSLAKGTYFSLGCRKGTDRESRSQLSSNLLSAIVNLQKLEGLHLFNCYSETWKSKIKNFLGSYQKTRTLREIVLRGGWYDEDEVHDLFRLMVLSLEKLALQGGNTQLTLHAFFQLLIGFWT
ncbi:MAG: hypothetical protein BYD32DRAFT_457092 [Podila humilis]|nr:MAG: hypothetical protein BYD32DRAFT_457092 [Podila humilis]